MRRKSAGGECRLCGVRRTRVAMAAHVGACAAKHDGAGGPKSEILRLRVEGRGSPLYWLEIEARASATLRDLDWYLRRIWVECCSHMSAFRIGKATYLKHVDRTLSIAEDERSMSTPIGEAVGRRKQPFLYEYDFGTTTELSLRLVGSRHGSTGHRKIRLLARNEPIVWPCQVCGEPASVLCTVCIYETDAFFCPIHAPEHECAEDEAFLPVVNSPRMGMCGYTGEGGHE